MASPYPARQLLRSISHLRNPLLRRHPSTSAPASPICFQCRLALSQPLSHHRSFQTDAPLSARRANPKESNPKLRTHDRGPASKEATQTDFGALDVFGNLPAPATGVDACTADGFVLNNDLRVAGSGVLLVDGECFAWRPWLQQQQQQQQQKAHNRTSDASSTGRAAESVHKQHHHPLRNARGAWEAPRAAWGVLDLVWPKPDLLIVGTGPSVLPLSPETRKHIAELGVRVEVQDTRNAAAQYNLLATERGTQQVAAALVPLGWKGV